MGTNQEPPAQADNGEEKARAAARKQLLIDYRMTFSGGHGERVWADLKQQFGYGKPSYRGGMTVDDALVIDGGKHVLAFIEEQITSDPNGRSEA